MFCKIHAAEPTDADAFQDTVLAEPDSILNDFPSLSGTGKTSLILLYHIVTAISRIFRFLYNFYNFFINFKIGTLTSYTILYILVITKIR